MTKNPDQLLTIKEAAFLSSVGRQAIYIAIKKGALKAHRDGKRWRIWRLDLDAYQAHKYNRDKMRKDGEYVFDNAKGFLSVPQTAKMLSESMLRYYPANRLYYLLRTGQLRGHRKGSFWVVAKEDALALMQEEIKQVGRRHG